MRDSPSSANHSAKSPSLSTTSAQSYHCLVAHVPATRRRGGYTGAEADGRRQGADGRGTMTMEGLLILGGAVIAVAAGVLAIGGAVVALRQARRFERRAPMGHVGHGALSFAVIEFQAADGRMVRFVKDSAGPLERYRLRVGQAVEVLYDPTNPQEARLASAVLPVLVPALLILPGCALLALGSCALLGMLALWLTARS